MTTEGVPYCCRRCIGGLNGSLWPLCSPLPPHILIYTDSLLLEIRWKRLYLCAFPSHTDICNDWAILLISVIYVFFNHGTPEVVQCTFLVIQESDRIGDIAIFDVVCLASSWNIGNQNLCSMGILLHHIPRAQPAPLALKLHLLQEPAPFHEKVTIKETPLPNDDGNWKTHFKQSARNF